jgi:hypothetical protein
MDFIGQNHVAWALMPDADLYDPDPATDVFNLKQYGHITFILFEGAGGTGTVKIEVEECTTAAGANNTAIAFRYRLMATTDTWGALTASAKTGYTTVAGANKAVAIEIDASELSDGYNFVRLQLTEVVDDPCDAAVIAILSEPRYAQAVPPTAIA